MTSFTHPDFPTTHAGVERVASALQAARQIGTRFRGAKRLVALFLAGAFSAWVVVADQVVNSWADGRMVLAWIGLWAVLFGAVLLFAEATRGWSDRLATAFESWSRARARQREDERTWSFALADPRLMTELQLARCRAENDAELSGEPAPVWPFSHRHLPASRRPARCI